MDGKRHDITLKLKHLPIRELQLILPRWQSDIFEAMRVFMKSFHTIKMSALAYAQGNAEMTDDEAIVVMNYLIITKNKGEKRFEKKASLNELKNTEEMDVRV